VSLVFCLTCTDFEGNWDAHNAMHYIDRSNDLFRNAHGEVGNLGSTFSG